MKLRRALSTTVIRLGPHNPLVIALVDRRCRKHGATLKDRGDYLALQKGPREMRLAPKHFVYAPDISERFETYFSPLVSTEEDGRPILDFSRPGILQTYARSGLQFEMSSFPEEEDAIESYFHCYSPRLGDTIFDIGAHCGVSTYHFSRKVGEGGRVIAFEPDPTNHALLLRNIERHRLTNVVPVQAAIAGSRGREQFNCEQSIGSGLARHSTRASVGTSIMVETMTLEDAFTTYGMPQFCKIDIEGSELEVISSSRHFLQTQKCEFALDTNHLVEGSFTDERIEKLFRELGYEAATSTSGMKTTWAHPARVVDEPAIAA